jgi:hypothetical protein
MTLNLAESFKNIEEKPDSLVAYFSENIHIRLIGCGVFDAATSRTVNFLFPAFFAVYYQKGSVELQHNGTSVRLIPRFLLHFPPLRCLHRKKNRRSAALLHLSAV